MRKRSYSDLAIFGGSPAFKQQLHVGRPNLPNRDRLYTLFDEALDRRYLTNNGPLARQLERDIAAYLGVRHVLLVDNATVGLQIAARATGMSGEILVPAFTFVATAHALEWIGMKPVLCDVDPHTHNLDVADVVRKITPDTGGIVGVHVWGRPCAIDELQAVAAEHKIPLVFDAAHAFGCSHGQQMVGQFGDAEVFSFHATKFLNTFEGGAITTNNDAVAERAGLMRNFGFAGVDKVVSGGTNAKMNEMSAAMGIASLEQVTEFIDRNRANYIRYGSNLAETPGVTLIDYDPSVRNNYQYIVVEVDAALASNTRDRLVDALWAENVLARRYFYPGLHHMAPYNAEPLDVPVTDSLSSRVFTLPNGTAVGPDEIDTICDIIHLAMAALQDSPAALPSTVH